MAIDGKPFEIVSDQILSMRKTLKRHKEHTPPYPSENFGHVKPIWDATAASLIELESQSRMSLI
jgi:hypothetical protein